MTATRAQRSDDRGAARVPAATPARPAGSSYVGFLGRFGSHPPERHPWWAGGRPAGRVGHEASMAILDLLADVPRPLRALRLSHVVRLCLTALSGYGQLPAGRQDGPYAGPGGDLPYDLYVTDLFDLAASALTAPASASFPTSAAPR